MALAQNDVWIFTADLDARAHELQADIKTLSSDEIVRFERFRVEIPARRFVAARAFLRETLSRLLSASPGSISFAYGPEGKPSIAEPRPPPELEFNLSHSAGLAALAVARDRAVGIDVEHVRDSVEIEALAERFFSSRERECLLSMPASGRRRAFFCCWTRKEAYLKARGGGLTTPLDRFDVTFAPGDAPRLLADRGDPDAPNAWQIHSVPLSPGTEAALVVAARADEFLSIQINPSTLKE